MSTLKVEHAVGGEDKFLVVEFEYFKGCRGARDSLGGIRGAGPPLEPDEPPSLEIESIKTDGGEEVYLTPTEKQQVEDKVWDFVRGDYVPDEDRGAA